MNLYKISILTKHVLGNVRWYMNFAKCKPIIFCQCSSKLAASILPRTRQSLKTGVAVPVLPARTLSLTACMFKSKNHSTENNPEEEEDEIDEAEIEELFQQQIPTDIGKEDHRIFIVHPDVKWGSRKQYLTTGKKKKRNYYLN